MSTHPPLSFRSSFQSDWLIDCSQSEDQKSEIRKRKEEPATQLPSYPTRHLCSTIDSGGIAQLVEHLPYKQTVGGSSPSTPKPNRIQSVKLYERRHSQPETQKLKNPNNIAFDFGVSTICGYCIVVVPLPSKQEVGVRFSLSAPQ